MKTYNFTCFSEAVKTSDLRYKLLNQNIVVLRNKKRNR